MFTKPKVTQSMIDAVNEALKGDQHKIDMNKNKKIDAQDFELLRNKKEVKEELKGDQHKIDKNKNNKIDSQDFAILRKQKKETYGEEAIARIIETSHLAKLRKEKAVEEEINVNVRTKDTLVGQKPTKQKDDVGPGADGKSTKVKFHGGPSSANEEVATKSKDEPPFTPDPVKKNPSAKAGKFGIQFSVARHLAKQGMKQAMKPVKEESLTAGKRLISKHGEGSHTARVYKDTEYNEYQVHHFKDGKHMGEGPVSYHDDKEDAQSTAEHSLKKRMGEEVDLQEKSDDYEVKQSKTDPDVHHVHYKGKKIGYVYGNKKDMWGHEYHAMGTGDDGHSSKREAVSALKADHKHHISGAYMKEEQIDELSTNTLKSYHTKAHSDMKAKGEKLGMRSGTKADWKRIHGMETAKSKMYSKGVDPFKEEVEQIDEKNVPTSPEKWAQAKAQAKAKFDVYPSAYANGWASKKYKAMGGGWKSVKEEQVQERTLTEPETQEKERIVKGMKKGLQGFKQRYGERAKSVMYATATKLAKEEKQCETPMSRTTKIAKAAFEAIKDRTKVK